MNTKELWQALQKELNSTLPEITYQLNMKNAVLLQADANSYCIGVSSIVAKEFCEMRLTGQIISFLNNKLGVPSIPYSVRFEVLSNQPQEKFNEQLSQKILESENVKDAIFLPSYEGVYENIVNPTRVIVLPGYFIEHLPYLGPQAGWVYTACFQLSFFNNHPNTAIPIRAKDGVRWSGLSKNTFWKQIGENPYLKHFVKLDRNNVPTGTQSYYVDKKGRKYRHVMINQEVKLKREANQYFVQHTMPLTPNDADALKIWLVSNKFSEHPIETLRKALQMPTKQLLGYSDNRKKQRAGKISDETQIPIHLVDLIYSLLPSDSEKKTSVLIQPLIDSLQNQIMLSFGHVFIPWYFVENWVSPLGAQKAWAVMLARKHCYQNSATGEIRNQFSFKHGFPEMAHYLRIKNPQSISLWFKTPNTRAGKPNLINLFMQLTASVKRKDQSVERRFSTTMNDLIAPQDLQQAFFSSNARSLLLSYKQEKDTHEKYLLLSVNEKNIHMIPISNLQKTMFAPLFNASPETHLLHDAALTWMVDVQASHHGFSFPESDQESTKLFEDLGYPNCILHSPINETGTFNKQGDNDLEPFRNSSLNESEIFTITPVIELRSFFSDRVNEFKTIQKQGNNESGIVTSNGLNESIPNIPVSLDEFGTIFKYLLNYISGNINTYKNISTPSTNYLSAKTSSLPSVVVEETNKISKENTKNQIVFQFQEIMNRCNISFVKQQELIQKGVSIQALISMLLFIASPQGERLGMGYVISRLLENSHGLTDTYGELASLPPEDLIMEIKNSLRIDIINNHIWRLAMGGAQDAKIDELFYRLGVE